jgi:hypothetical protein
MTKWSAFFPQKWYVNFKVGRRMFLVNTTITKKLAQGSLTTDHIWAKITAGHGGRETENYHELFRDQSIASSGFRFSRHRPLASKMQNAS